MGIEFRTNESRNIARTPGEFNLRQLKSLRQAVLAARDNASKARENNQESIGQREKDNYSRDYYSWDSLAWELKRLINTIESKNEGYRS